MAPASGPILAVVKLIHGGGFRAATVPFVQSVSIRVGTSCSIITIALIGQSGDDLRHPAVIASLGEKAEASRKPLKVASVSGLVDSR